MIIFLIYSWIATRWNLLPITFNEWNIAVYEHTPDTEALLLSGESAASDGEDAEEEAEAALSTVVDSEFGRTTIL